MRMCGLALLLFFAFLTVVKFTEFDGRPALRFILYGAYWYHAAEVIDAATILLLVKLLAFADLNHAR